MFHPRISCASPCLCCSLILLAIESSSVAYFLFSVILPLEPPFSLSQSFVSLFLSIVGSSTRLSSLFASRVIRTPSAFYRSTILSLRSVSPIIFHTAALLHTQLETLIYGSHTGIRTRTRRLPDCIGNMCPIGMFNSASN